MEQNINDHFTSTEPNSNIDNGLFDVTEFEKERVELDEKKWSLFEAATTYSDCICLWTYILRNRKVRLEKIQHNYRIIGIL